MLSNTNQACVQVQLFLQQTFASSGQTVLTAKLVAHIVGCAECRGALVLLAAELTDTFQIPAPISCVVCQAQLAAYIDRETEAGIQAAIQDHPQIWWHSWSCADCAEIYTLTRALADASDAGMLAPMPIIVTAMTPSARSLRTFRLSRTFLTYALPHPTPVLGALRGSAGGTVLMDDEEAGHRTTLSVQQQPDANWSVSVTVVPPIAGWLVLTLGQHTFRARFDEHGDAMVPDVPALLLGDAIGPELIVGFELDEGDQPT